MGRYIRHNGLGNINMNRTSSGKQKNMIGAGADPPYHLVVTLCFGASRMGDDVYIRVKYRRIEAWFPTFLG